MSGLTERLKVIREKVEELKVERREGALERREKVKSRSGAELAVREMEESGSESSLPFRIYQNFCADTVSVRDLQRKVKID